MRASTLQLHFDHEVDTAAAGANRFAIAAYKKVARVLKMIPADDDVTAARIDGLDLTDHMKDKLKGLLKKRGKPKPLIRPLLESVPGIGPKKANELVADGVETLAQLKKRKDLPEISRIYLSKRPETIIPRDVIARIEQRIGTPDTIFVGSYRRRRPTSKDIDIMLVAPSIDPYLDYLSRCFPNIWMYARGPDKASFVVPFEKKNYKLDVFRTENKWPMLLYATGSKEFNVRMRQRAKSMGLLLNQNGLFRDGKPLAVQSEKGFFDALGMAYLAPEDRT